jgi:hypothetical protein
MPGYDLDGLLVGPGPEFDSGGFPHGETSKKDTCYKKDTIFIEWRFFVFILLARINAINCV